MCAVSDVHFWAMCYTLRMTNATEIYKFDQRDDLEPLVRQKLNENFRRIQRRLADQDGIDQYIYANAGGTDDYNDLINKPSIEEVELIGDKTFPELGIFIDPEEQYPQSDDYALTNIEITDLWNAVIA